MDSDAAWRGQKDMGTPALFPFLDEPLRRQEDHRLGDPVEVFSQVLSNASASPLSGLTDDVVEHYPTTAFGLQLHVPLNSSGAYSR